MSSELSNMLLYCSGNCLLKGDKLFSMKPSFVARQGTRAPQTKHIFPT